MHHPCEHPRAARRLAIVAALVLGAALSSHAATPTKPPVIVSPDVSADGHVTFRLFAPDAHAVGVKGIRHLPEQPMAKDENGVWSVTVGPLTADIYSYTFTIDSANVTDPHDRDIKKYFSSESLFEVPGHPPILAEMQAVPHGTVHHQFYASRVRGIDAGLEVYTPPGYDPRASTLYPVVYLLHGFGDREEAWIDAGHANTIADNLIAQGRIQPMLIVMPYGHPVPVEEDSKYQDYEGKNREAMAKDLIGQIIPMIEHDYRADPQPDKRAIVGLSMGGGQSLDIGLYHPELFRWVGAFSAAAPDKDLDATYAKVVNDPASRPRLLWIAIGRDDFLFKRNVAFHDWLDKKGIPSTWVVSDGGHEWPNWRAYLPQFLGLVFR